MGTDPPTQDRLSQLAASWQKVIVDGVERKVHLGVVVVVAAALRAVGRGGRSSLRIIITTDHTALPLHPAFAFSRTMCAYHT